MAVELDRKIVRGGVYWVRSLDEWGGSAGSLGRPAVVVSSNYSNEYGRDINVVFCSTNTKPHPYNVKISCTNKQSVAKCDQLAVIDKDRFGQKMGDVVEEEMKQIDETLALCLGLTLHKSDVDEALEAEKAKVAGLEEELMAKRVEIAMLERLYGKALDMMAGVRLTKDLQTPVQKKTEPVKPRVPRIVPDEPEQTGMIMDDLEYHGAGKVNVNTASWKDLVDKLGIPPTIAHGICGYRKKNGNYRSLNDLLNANRFSQHHLDKYGAMMEV